MKKHLKFLFLLFILSGCSGVGDYESSLGNGFQLFRASAHKVFIIEHSLGSSSGREVEIEDIEFIMKRAFSEI